MNCIKKNFGTAAMMTAFAIAAVTTSGCLPSQPITYTSFAPEAGTFASTQTVQITLPTTAQKVYLTTDSIDPVEDTRCAYHGENLLLTKPTIVKLRYEIDGIVHTYERRYLIEDGITEHDFTNRTVITTWERFFIHHVLHQFNPPGDESSLLRIDDDENGFITLRTNILARTIYGVPKKGEQIYDFTFFEKTDADSGETVMLEDGTVYGYRDEDGGFYSSIRNGGRTIRYKGTYSGWADADFDMDANGITTSGYYRVYCHDDNCAPLPVYYLLDGNNRLVEVDPTIDAQTRTCGEQTTP